MRDDVGSICLIEFKNQTEWNKTFSSLINGILISAKKKMRKALNDLKIKASLSYSHLYKKQLLYVKIFLNKKKHNSSEQPCMQLK